MITAKVAKAHAARVEQFERRVCSQLRERQKVFEAAFMEQMKNYRELGRVPGGKYLCSSSSCCCSSSENSEDIVGFEGHWFIVKVTTRSSDVQNFGMA